MDHDWELIKGVNIGHYCNWYLVIQGPDVPYLFIYLPVGIITNVSFFNELPELLLLDQEKKEL